MTNQPSAREADYDQFVAELTAITRKYGVAIQAIGGVVIAETAADFATVTYVADITSGDLYPRLSDA